MLLVFFCCEQPIIKVIFKPKKGDEEMSIRIIKTSTNVQKFVAIINGLYSRNRDTTTDWTLNSDYISEVLRNNRVVQSGSFISQLWKK